MKVVAAVNGLIPSEVAAFYALRYAALHGFPLVLLHVLNVEDSMDDVVRSMAVIEKAAAVVVVSGERVLLRGQPCREIRKYLAEYRVDTLFCRTSRQRRFWRDSLFCICTAGTTANGSWPIHCCIGRP